ncbi:aspartoacylase [compost metagenome]
MHGNETLGISLVEVLKANPLLGVDAVIANQPALDQEVRFTSVDLNPTFPGVADSLLYEERRANELMSLAQDYDVVLDFHNTFCPDNDCTFVGEKGNQILDRVAGYLGLMKMVVADYDCINKYLPNCISIEVSMSSELNSVDYWYEKIKRLSSVDALPEAVELEKYRFAYRMTLDDRDRLDLDRRSLRAFQPLPSDITRELGLTQEAYPIFIADTFTPYNYGGILYKM